MIWALVKNRVAMDWSPNRKMREVQLHLWNAFYGGPKQNANDESWTPVDGQACLSRIRKCCHNARERINRDPYLAGDIWNLSEVPEDQIAREDRDEYVAAEPWANENDDDVDDDLLTDAAGVDDVEGAPLPDPVEGSLEQMSRDALKKRAQQFGLTAEQLRTFGHGNSRATYIKAISAASARVALVGRAEHQTSGGGGGGGGAANPNIDDDGLDNLNLPALKEKAALLGLTDEQVSGFVVSGRADDKETYIAALRDAARLIASVGLQL
jgi:hypothetical protein